MISKIINMAEKIKDAEDRTLESLFASEPVADDGFSDRVVRRINRQMWIRRLTLPTAAVIGGLISFKPLVGLLTSMSGLVAALPLDSIAPSTAALPQVQMILMGAVLLGAGLFSAKLLQQ